MADDGVLRERLRKIEALLAGAATAGERNAAQAARQRLMARLAQDEKRGGVEEIQFTLHDQWARRLFVALCRRYNIEPYRYPRQRRTTLIVRAPTTFVQTVLWPEFNELSAVLFDYLDRATERIIRDEIHADASEAPERNAPRRK